MSIQTELTRIKNAKAAIKAAVEGKGVTVPDGTLLDGMAALIESIEAGGGGVELQYNRLYSAATGTFTPAEQTEFTVDSPLVIEHNAGIVPFVVMVKSDGMDATGDLEFIVSWRIPHWNESYYDENRLYSVSSRRGSRPGEVTTAYGVAYRPKLGAWDIKSVDVAQNSASISVNAGKTYKWNVYGIE